VIVFIKKSVDSILASITKNITDLRSFSETERKTAESETAEAERLQVAASARTAEANRAEVVAGRLSALIGATDAG
jgi:hypothetical protein